MPEQLKVPETHVYFGVGTGWSTYRRELTDLLGEQHEGHDAEVLPRARDILKLAVREYEEGRTVAADQALPVYLRNKVTG